MSFWDFEAISNYTIIFVFLTQKIYSPCLPGISLFKNLAFEIIPSDFINLLAISTFYSSK